MSILPKKLNKNHYHWSLTVTEAVLHWLSRQQNHLSRRRIESIRGRIDWSLVLVYLEVSSFISIPTGVNVVHPLAVPVTVLKGWSIYNLKTNGKVNRIKTK